MKDLLAGTSACRIDIRGPIEIASSGVNPDREGSRLGFGNQSSYTAASGGLESIRMIRGVNHVSGRDNL